MSPMQQTRKRSTAIREHHEKKEEKPSEFRGALVDN
jgi:hypothetical protein